MAGRINTAILVLLLVGVAGVVDAQVGPDVRGVVRTKLAVDRGASILVVDGSENGPRRRRQPGPVSYGRSQYGMATLTIDRPALRPIVAIS